MLNIKKFIDKVSASEKYRGGHTLVLSIDEARLLRDEISKLVADNYDLLSSKQKVQEVIQVEVNGGKW